MKMRKLIMMFAALILAATGAYADDLDTQYAKELLQPGTEVPDFTMLMPDGKQLKMSELKGKYVVIDFWASWCPDCRKDIPMVRELNEKYGEKVTFVGVSFDDDRNRWVNCLQKEQMTWKQVCELKKMRDSDVAKAYGVKWIPSMMVISPEGKVVLATVMIEKLEQKLEEITK